MENSYSHESIKDIQHTQEHYIFPLCNLSNTLVSSTVQGFSLNVHSDLKLR